jgi:NADP-dependent aldehyde dehydrogenase
MPLTGLSFIGSRRGALGGLSIHTLNPATGQQLDPVYSSASPAEVDQAARLAAQAFPVYAATSGKAKGAFLRHIADGLDALQQQLAERAHVESALPMPRLLSEVTD